LFVRKLRFVLPLFVVLLAIPAATAHAVSRMPVGFFDDPSFRWSEDTTQNLLEAQRAHASIVHILANWATIAKFRPANPLNGNDPAYVLKDIDQLTLSAEQYGMEVLLTVTGTPAWANGGKTPNIAPKNMNDLTSFMQMLATRYSGKNPRYGTVTRFSIWNEPNLGIFLEPQFDASGKIVSPKLYAKLFMAGYKGVKAGNPKAMVAAGETSNRGRNRPAPGTANDSVAPATFAHMVAQADPKLPLTAWATHPYPDIYALGPSQRVAYPNVAFSTMKRFGDDLTKWFGHRVPIWVTEYGEQTVPEYNKGGVSYAKQAQDAKKALQLANENPYVEMFTWFIFRDSDHSTWFSGVVRTNGRKKPAYGTFAATAKNMVGFTQTIPAGKTISVTIPVPSLAYYNRPGTKIGLTYGLFDGKKKLAVAQPIVKLQSGGYVTIPVNYKAVKGKTYTLGVTLNDPHGHIVKTTILLMPAS
jgi:hypothetical protein